MKICIIGAGAVGGALGGVWAHRGHRILYGVRDRESPRARETVEATTGSAMVDVATAVMEADVVLLAVNWPGVQTALAAAGDMTGRILIDATNPLRPDFSDLEAGYSLSGGERVAQWAPGARVYKAFNTTAAENMAHAQRFRDPPAMFVAGDEPEGKAVVMALVAETGFAGVDAGPLVSARLLEPLAMLYIRVAWSTPLGRDWALGILKPTSDGK